MTSIIFWHTFFCIIFIKSISKKAKSPLGHFSNTNFIFYHPKNVLIYYYCLGGTDEYMVNIPALWTLLRPGLRLKVSNGSKIGISISSRHLLTSQTFKFKSSSQIFFRWTFTFALHTRTV